MNKIVKNLEKMREDIFLQNSIPFMIKPWSKYPEIKEAAKKIWMELPLDRKHKKTKRNMKKALKYILCNLAIGAYYGKCVAIPRKAVFFQEMPHFRNAAITRCSFLTVIDSMVDNRWIHITLGHPKQTTNTNESYSRGNTTRIWASNKLLERFDFSLKDFLSQSTIPEETVVVKDNKGNKININTPETTKIKNNINYINSILNKHHIESSIISKEYYPNPYHPSFDNKILPYFKLHIPNITKQEIINHAIYTPLYPHRHKPTSSNNYFFHYGNKNALELCGRRLLPQLKAVFNRSSLTCGGRLYCEAFMGISFQSLSQEERSTIKIDGEATVEYDYSGFHINILYALKGLQLDIIPYELPGVPKILTKKLLLISLNEKSEAKIPSTMAHEVYTLKNKPLVSKRDLSFLQAANKLEAEDWKDMISKVKSLHFPIKEHFCSDAGIHLMGIDSAIMMKVLLHFAEEGIPALPIHDSVIVPERYGEELKYVMEETYKKHMNGFSCKVDKK